MFDGSLARESLGTKGGEGQEYSCFFLCFLQIFVENCYRFEKTN